MMSIGFMTLKEDPKGGWDVVERHYPDCLHEDPYHNVREDVWRERLTKEIALRELEQLGKRFDYPVIESQQNIITIIPLGPKYYQIVELSPYGNVHVVEESVMSFQDAITNAKLIASERHLPFLGPSEEIQ